MWLPNCASGFASGSCNRCSQQTVTQLRKPRTPCLQTELAIAKAQLIKASAENKALRTQNDEINTELAWVIKDLFRLKQQETAGRCLAWLQEAEGLSTVRVLPENAKGHVAQPWGPTGALLTTPPSLACRSRKCRFHEEMVKCMHAQCWAI
jgi:hypothetical protein